MSSEYEVCYRIKKRFRRNSETEAKAVAREYAQEMLSVSGEVRYTLHKLLSPGDVLLEEVRVRGSRGGER